MLHGAAVVVPLRAERAVQQERGRCALSNEPGVLGGRSVPGGSLPSDRAELVWAPRGRFVAAVLPRRGRTPLPGAAEECASWGGRGQRAGVVVPLAFSSPVTSVRPKRVRAS